MTSDSLSGQNNGRRADGVRSSRTRSTKSQKTKLWKRLRRLDAECSRTRYVKYPWTLSNHAEELFKKADQKRKEIRLKLKGYL